MYSTRITPFADNLYKTCNNGGNSNANNTPLTRCTSASRTPFVYGNWANVKRRMLCSKACFKHEHQRQAGFQHCDNGSTVQRLYIIYVCVAYVFMYLYVCIYIYMRNTRPHLIATTINDLPSLQSQSTAGHVTAISGGCYQHNRNSHSNNNKNKQSTTSKR